MNAGGLGTRLAANLSMMFVEVPFLQRFQAAADAGFRFVEFQFPYAYDLDDIRSAIEAADVALVMHNFPSGDWDAGERGLAVEPALSARFVGSIEVGLEAVEILGTPRMNCLAGIVDNSRTKNSLRKNLVANFSYAASRLDEAGRALLIEPLNNQDVPGFALNRASDVLALLDEMKTKNAFLQLDIYHAHVMGEDIVRIIETGIERIGHVQIADNPGRHEPGSGKIDFTRVFDCLTANGYRKYVGCEYMPAGDTVAGLGWRGIIFPASGMTENPE
ncbi:MAG: TIM barrel protein [Rhizobiales bacterium]|nr:TIM barrel protein [Hyphomicrobiales bacterium]